VASISNIRPCKVEEPTTSPFPFLAALHVLGPFFAFLFLQTILRMILKLIRHPDFFLHNEGCVFLALAVSSATRQLWNELVFHCLIRFESL